MLDRCPRCGVKLIQSGSAKICPNCGVVEDINSFSNKSESEEIPSYLG